MTRTTMTGPDGSTEPCLNLSHTTRGELPVYCDHPGTAHDADGCTADGCECMSYRTDGAEA